MDISKEPPNRYKAHISDVLNKLLRQCPQVVRNPATRRVMVKIVEQSLLESLDLSRKKTALTPGVNENRTALYLCLLKTVERMLVDYDLSEGALQGLMGLLIRDQLVNKKARREKERAFSRLYGLTPPSFLMINPAPPEGNAAAEAATAGLDRQTFDRLIVEAKTLWDARLILVTGNNTLSYVSSQINIFDLAEKHPDVFFMVSMDATGCDEKICRRIGDLGNISPVLQIPLCAGLDDNIPAMQRFYKMNIPFGVLITATRDSVESLLHGPVFNIIFKDQHALYGMVSPCALNGAPTRLDDILTAQQRLALWRRSQQLIRNEDILLIDAWNYGTLTGGCLAGGGCGYGGYLYIDWKGDVSPCVLVPYAAANVKRVYAQGGSLNDIWSLPFFGAIRAWQKTQRGNNLLTNCLFWDHHASLNQILDASPVYNMNEDAAVLLRSPSYQERLDEYARVFGSAAGNIWKEYYLRARKFLFDLPDMDGLLNIQNK